MIAMNRFISFSPKLTKAKPQKRIINVLVAPRYMYTDVFLAYNPLPLYLLITV